MGTDRISHGLKEGWIPHSFGRQGGMGRSRFYSPREIAVIATAVELAALNIALHDAFPIALHTSDPVVTFLLDWPGGVDFEGPAADRKGEVRKIVAETWPSWRFVWVPLPIREPGDELAGAYCLSRLDDIPAKAPGATGGIALDLREVARRLAARLEAPLHRVSVAEGNAEAAE